MRDKIFHGMSSQLPCKLSDLPNHEYYGQDFLDGTMEYLVVSKENGRLMVIVTSGTWESMLSGVIEQNPADAWMNWAALINPRGAKTVINLNDCYIIGSMDDLARVIAAEGDVKVPVWTLK